MSKTKKLREAVKSAIDTALVDAGISTQSTPVSIYWQKAKNGHSSKFVVFTTEELLREDGKITMELEINCVQQTSDSEGVEDMADVIQTAFDHKTFTTADIIFNTYANRRNSVDNDDANVVRRRLTYDLYLYERT